LDWFGILRAGDAFSLSAIFAFRDDAEKQLFLFAYVSRQLGGPACVTSPVWLQVLAITAPSEFLGQTRSTSFH